MEVQGDLEHLLSVFSRSLDQSNGRKRVAKMSRDAAKTEVKDRATGNKDADLNPAT